MAQKTHVMHGRDHLATGADPIPGLAGIPSGDTIDAKIMGLNPAGFWKLNESSGMVAADSSGNRLDLSDDFASPPLWGAPAGPPGQPAANFQNGTTGPPGTGTAARVARAWPPITTDFTAAIFVKFNAGSSASDIIGHANPLRAGGTGWQLYYNSSRYPVAGIAGLGTITATNPVAAGVWVLLALVHQGSGWRLNINGLDQPTTLSGSYTVVPSTLPLWIGHDGGLGFVSLNVPQFTGSYAFLIPSALTGAQLLDIYTTAIIPGGADAGKTLIATGLGATTWDFAIEVTY